MSLRLILAGGSMLLGACTSVPRPSAPAESQAIEQGHLLLFPVDDAESLLGRPLKITDDGAWSIADRRPPGCEVAVRRRAAEYHVERRVKIESLTALAGSFSKLIGVDAGYAAATDVDIDIDNTTVLEADTRGDCGDAFIDRVFVGKGRRKLVRKADAEVSASLVSVPGAPSGGHEAHSEQIDALAWDTEQAYAFDFKRASEGDRGFSIRIDMPRRVTEGDAITVTLSSTAEASLVVISLDEAGNGTVLWPSTEEPAPRIRPAEPATLPSPREVAAGFEIRAALAEPGRPAREALIVYGFRDESVYDRMRPAPDAAPGDAAREAAALTERAEALSLSEWARSLQSYVIVPKAAQ